MLLLLHTLHRSSWRGWIKILSVWSLPFALTHASELTPVESIILKKLEIQDQEFKDFADIEACIQNQSISEFKEKSENFRKKYLLSAYQNVFPILETFVTYKLNKKQSETPLKIETFQLSPELNRYQTYLKALWTAEHAQYGWFFEKIPFAAPSYSVYQNQVQQACQLFENLLQKAPRSLYAQDSARRLYALKHRLALGDLNRLICNFKEKNHIAVVQDGLRFLEVYPQTRLSVQSILVTLASLEALQLHELTPPLRSLYLQNRHQLFPLLETPRASLSSWLEISQLFDFAQPEAHDRFAFELEKRLIQPAFHLIAESKHQNTYHADFEFRTQEEKGVEQLNQLRTFASHWISSYHALLDLHASASELELSSETEEMAEKLQEQWEHLLRLGDQLTPMDLLTFQASDWQFDFEALKERENEIKSQLIQAASGSKQPDA